MPGSTWSAPADIWTPTGWRVCAWASRPPNRRSSFEEFWREALVRAHAQVQAQAAELAVWNKTLEERVAAQLVEIERMARLKRFFAPSLAELIVSSGNERILESHRRDIAVLFCDLRGFTAFAESAEPEEVMELLHNYHGSLVPLIQVFEGTLDRFVGDG